MLLPIVVSFMVSAPPAPTPAPAPQPASTEPVATLLPQLEACEEMDCAALRALVSKGPKVWPDLEKGIDDPKELIRFWSIGVLAEVPVPEAKDKLVKLLREEPLARLRAASAFALASYPPGPDVTGELVTALSDIDPNVRFEAASALARRPADPTAFAPLVKALDDKDEDVRAAAADALGQGGKAARTAAITKALLAKVSDRKPPMRGRVAIALAQIGAPEAVAPLIARIGRERDETALAAVAWALGELGDKTAIDPLKTLAQHPSDVVKQHAAEALQRLTAPAPEAPPK